MVRAPWTMKTRLLIALPTIALMCLLPVLAVCTRDGDTLSIESVRGIGERGGQAGEGDAPVSSPEPTPAAPPASTPSPKQVPVSDAEILRGPTDIPRVSLVINAGSGYPPAEALLDILAAKNVKTTFFLMGWWAERNPDLVRRIHAEGQEIASHGYRVFDLTEVSDAAVAEDLEHADAVISGITGVTTRPLWSPSAGYRDARVRAIAARLGYRPILWTQDSGDWRENATADGVFRQAMAGAVNGSIIVLHLDSPQSRSATVAILGRLIDALRAQGLEPVTISELVGE
jgi:peptidoglycan/xylan/chitin deacetylase (PgdA/CDA1 family)